MNFKTENFYLRLIQLNDTQDLLDFELRNRAFFTKTSPTRSETFFTFDGKKRFIESQIQAHKENLGHSFCMFNHQDELIGWVSLFEVLDVPNINSCFLGYRIDEAYQGKGYMSEAVKLICDYAFKTLKLHRIEAGVMVNNFGSQKVLEKNGFIQEGLNRKNVQIDGVWEDHYIYGYLNPYE